MQRGERRGKTAVSPDFARRPFCRELTELALTYYQDEASTIPDFLNSFVTGNIVPEDFPDQLNADCSEIHDVVFSLQALYSGDTEPTTVVQRQGILAVKNADGWYLLG